MRGIDGGGCRSSGQDDRRIGGALEIRGHGAGALIGAAAASCGRADAARRFAGKARHGRGAARPRRRGDRMINPILPRHPQVFPDR